MDKSFKTFFRHAMKVTVDYFVVLLLFAILSYPILSMAGENPRMPVGVISFLLFLALFGLTYRDFFEIAVREKRPQYEINPTPIRGLLLALLGLVPVWVLQLVTFLLPLDENEVFRRRILQVLSVPFYWLGSLLGVWAPLYVVLTGLTVVMVFLGYLAGLHEFYLMQRIYKLVGYTPKKRIVKPRGKKPNGKGFWGM